MGRILVGTVLIIVGLNALMGFNLWEYFWPGLLIVLGAWFILGKPGHKNHHRWQEAKVVGDDKDTINYNLTFAGTDRKISSENFKGGFVDVTFGGANLDLRDAKIKSKEPVIIKIDATLGGMKLIVPKSWKVEIDIKTIAAGIHDATTSPAEKDRTGTLKLVGNATLGGVEITN